jgi:hypothetical protein
VLADQAAHLTLNQVLLVTELIVYLVHIQPLAGEAVETGVKTERLVVQVAVVAEMAVTVIHLALLVKDIKVLVLVRLVALVQAAVVVAVLVELVMLVLHQAQALAVLVLTGNR